jgi:erythrin-vacuolar iron transport family protein
MVQHTQDSNQQIDNPEIRVEQPGKKVTVKEEIAAIVYALRNNDDTSHEFLLRVVQPGLAGLMDGSVSTLAPIFATAFATHNPFTAFLVGIASATGAGISMAFSEGLSDDGELTGRGSPVVRGGITGIMTLLGGALHTLPFLIHNITIALVLAYVVVAVELVLIAAIRHRYFGTQWLKSMVQVVGSGILVFIAALIFGNA